MNLVVPSGPVKEKPENIASILRRVVYIVLLLVFRNDIKIILQGVDWNFILIIN